MKYHIHRIFSASKRKNGMSLPFWDRKEGLVFFLISHHEDNISHRLCVTLIPAIPEGKNIEAPLCAG